MPREYIVAMRIIYDIANLKIVPIEVKKWVFSSINGNYVDIAEDLGDLIVMLIIFSFITLIIAIISFLSYKFEKFNDII
jgi:hypothetical protein